MANTKVTGDLIAGLTIATGNIADDAVTSDKISGITTAHIAEGSNLYYTNARADARITAATTSDLSEGTNLYYTDARADARAALLVDSAPSTLDTLNELAAALGDDPNFATTTANSIGTKMPLAGGTFTGSITGLTSSFVSTVAGTTVVSAEGAYAGSGSVKLFEAKRNGGAVKSDWDYHDSSPIRMSIGTSTSHNFAIKTADTPRLTILSGGNVGIGTESPGARIDIKGVSGSPATSGTTQNGILRIQNNGNNNTLDIGQITSTPYGTWLQAADKSDLAPSNTYPLILNPVGGKVGIGTTAPNKALTVYGGNDNGIWVDSSGSQYTSVAWGNNGTEKANIAYDNTNANLAVTAYGASKTIFSNNGSERMRIRETGAIEIKGSSTTASAQAYITNDNSLLTIGSSVSGSVVKDIQFSSPSAMMYIDGSTASVGIGTTSPTGKITSEAAGNHLHLRASTAAAGKYWNFDVTSNNQLFIITDGNNGMNITNTGNVGIGATSPAGKLEVAGGSTLGLRLSNLGDQSAYDQVRMTYSGYNSGAPTVTFMPLTTPGGGNVDTTFHFSNTNGIGANNNRANVNIDGVLDLGSGRQSGETTLVMRNYDPSLVDSNEIQNSIRMSGRYWSGSSSQLVETRINSVHQESNGNGGSALTFWTQTGGSAATEQMRIDKVGNVGIGVTPTQKLDVNGQMSHEGLVMKSGTGLYVDTLTTFNITLDFVAGNWVSTGLTSSSNNGLTLGESGTYIIQIYSDDHSPGEPYWYSMYWSGIMSWYNSTTNQSNTQNPIVLQKAGHGDNNRSLEAQILWQTSSGTPANNGLLQLKCSATAPGTNLRLKFRRLI